MMRFSNFLLRPMAARLQTILQSGVTPLFHSPRRIAVLVPSQYFTVIGKKMRDNEIEFANWLRIHFLLLCNGMVMGDEIRCLLLFRLPLHSTWRHTIRLYLDISQRSKIENENITKIYSFIDVHVCCCCNPLLLDFQLPIH